MRLIQYLDELGAPRVATVAGLGEPVRRIEGFASAYELAQAAIAGGASLQQVVEASQLSADAQSYAQLLAGVRVLTPLMHPDPARCLVSGTGLTHLGSASARDAMHQKVAGDEAALSDSMRMFKWGLDGGRPEGSEPGVQPANMCHSLANLEYHHFKYAAHRRAGDVHLHFFGTATLSFSDGVRVAPGDRFEIDLPALGAPLVNALEHEAERFALRGVRAL